MGKDLHFELTSLTDVQLEQLSPAWQELADHALEPNPNFMPMMMKSALTNLINSKKGFSLLLAWDEEKLVAILVLSAHPWNGKLSPIWTLWSHLYSFCGLPLIHSSYSDIFFDAVFQWLEEHSSKPAILLPNIPATEGTIHHALFSTLNRTRRNHRIFNKHQRAIIRSDLSGDDYLQQSLGKKRHKEYRRQHRRLSEQGQLTTTILGADDDIQLWCDEFFDLEARGWKGKQGTAIACKKDHAAYMRETLCGLYQQNGLHMIRMALDDKPIAMCIIPKAGAKAWALKIAYDENYAKFSPGVLLILDITRLLANDKTISLGDSIAVPDHPMINHIWRERLEVHDVLVSTTQNESFFKLTASFEHNRLKLRQLVKNVYLRVQQGTK